MSENYFFKYIKNIITIILLLMYPLIWTYSDFIQGVNFDNIVDRVNYINYAQIELNLSTLDVHDELLKFLINEPLFFLIVALIQFITDNFIYSIRFLIFIISYLGGVYVYKKTNNLYLTVLILFFPQVYGNYVMSLRQGAALAFFLIGLIINNRIRYFFILCTPFIHNSFFLTIIFYAIGCIYLKYNLSLYKSILISMVINYIIFNNILIFATEMGVRQASDYNAYGGATDEVSGYGFILWIIILLLYIFGFRKINIHDTYIKYDIVNVHFSLISIIFFLFSYFTIPPLARSIQNSAIIILVLSVYLTGNIYKLFILLMIVIFTYTIINFINGGILNGYIN